MEGFVDLVAEQLATLDLVALVELHQVIIQKSATTRGSEPTARPLSAHGSNALRSLTVRAAKAISDQQVAAREAMLLPSAEPNEHDEKPLEYFNALLSERTFNGLMRSRFETIGALRKATADDLLAITNFNEKSLKEVREALAGLGLKLADPPPTEDG